MLAKHGRCEWCVFRCAFRYYSYTMEAQICWGSIIEALRTPMGKDIMLELHEER
jgi:hypothetical protein